MVLVAMSYVPIAAILLVGLLFPEVGTHCQVCVVVQSMCTPLYLKLYMQLISLHVYAV